MDYPDQWLSSRFVTVLLCPVRGPSHCSSACCALLFGPLLFLSAQLRFRNIGVDNGKYLKSTSAEEIEAWGVN